MAHGEIVCAEKGTGKIGIISTTPRAIGIKTENRMKNIERGYQSVTSSSSSQ